MSGTELLVAGFVVVVAFALGWWARGARARRTRSGGGVDAAIVAVELHRAHQAIVRAARAQRNGQGVLQRIDELDAADASLAGIAGRDPTLEVHVLRTQRALALIRSVADADPSDQHARAAFLAAADVSRQAAESAIRIAHENAHGA